MKKQDVTRAMINKYPELLTKFMDKKEKVAPLIEVILYLNLQLYSPKVVTNYFVLACYLINIVLQFILEVLTLLTS